MLTLCSYRRFPPHRETGNIATCGTVQWEKHFIRSVCVCT